jgi:hypothetical protein
MSDALNAVPSAVEASRPCTGTIIDTSAPSRFLSIAACRRAVGQGSPVPSPSRSIWLSTPMVFTAVIPAPDAAARSASSALTSFSPGCGIR